MKTQVKVYAKAQNRLALGIVKAFYALNPQSTLADLKKAFPDGINPDCGSKQIFMPEKEIKKHIDSGEEWYASARGYFVGDDEWLVMANGERIGVVSMWSKPSTDRLIEQAKKYGIEAEESDEKRGTYRLEYLNGGKSASQNGKSKKENEEPLQTYLFRIDADSLYRIDVLELENADDDIIEEGFENQETWTEVVNNTQCLFTRVEDLNDEDSWDSEPDEFVEAFPKLLDMIGDSDVHTGNVFPDAEEDFKVVVLNEDEEEIKTIDGSDIKTFSMCEDGYGYPDGDKIDDIDIEDNATRKLTKEFLKKNGLGPHVICDDFGLYKEGWTWVNVEHGEPNDAPIYELKTRGKFDPKKLLLKKVRVEEAFAGLKSIDVITDMIYDGERLECYNRGDVMYDDVTNFFIKRDSEDVFPSAVYDMTNYEKSE